MIGPFERAALGWWHENVVDFGFLELSKNFERVVIRRVSLSLFLFFLDSFYYKRSTNFFQDEASGGISTSAQQPLTAGKPCI